MNATPRTERLSVSALTIFGPVPSRRLGQSLGIGNVPPKTCSYSCVYCQVGPTPATEIESRSFWSPDTVVEAVRRHVDKLRRQNERVDYLTFVPDGEPTLDRNLGQEIDGLQSLGIPIAVISNGSLAWRADVRAALAKADWVSLKVDAADEATWKRINRTSHRSIRIDDARCDRRADVALSALSRLARNEGAHRDRTRQASITRPKTKLPRLSAK